MREPCGGGPEKMCGFAGLFIWESNLSTLQLEESRSQGETDDAGKHCWGPRSYKRWAEIQAIHEGCSVCQLGPLLWMARGTDGRWGGEQHPGRAADEKLTWHCSPCISQARPCAEVSGVGMPPPRCSVLSPTYFLSYRWLLIYLILHKNILPCLFLTFFFCIY